MIESRKDLKDRAASLQSDLDASEETLLQCQAELSSAKDEIAAATQALVAEQEAHAKASSELEDTREALESSEKNLEAAMAKLESFDAEVEKASSAKADAALQSVGAGSIELEGSADPLGEEDILERAAAIDDPTESAQFYEDNATAIRQALFSR